MKGMVYKMDLKQLNELLDLALEQPEEVEEKHDKPGFPNR